MRHNASKNKKIEGDPRGDASTLFDVLARSGFNSPDLFVQQIDLLAGTAAVLRMSRAAYRAAAFLDARLLPLTPDGFIMPHDHLVRWTHAITEPPRPIHFIFHAGHVGSTLLSRIIEEADGALSLREPRTLCTLASIHDTLSSASGEFESALATQVRLWRRGYDDTRCVVVKATSDAARIGERLMQEAPDAQAILLNVTAETSLASTLSSSMSDLQTKGQERFGRLCRLLGSAEPVASAGEAAAMSWLAEQLTQQRIAGACPGRTLRIDFDAFLGDPGLHLRAIFQHLSLHATPTLIDGIATHRLMQHYAKSPDKPYSAETRAERLKQSRRDHGDEIGRGLAWLERMAGAHPSTGAALAG